MTIISALPQTTSELGTLCSELERDLDDVAALGSESAASLLNDYYYVQTAFRQNDLDKLRVFKKLAASFRTRLHLLESVIDILRDDLGYSDAAPVISEARVDAYSIVLHSFSGLGRIPDGAITRATVRAVGAPEEAKVLAAQIRNKQFV